MDEEEEGDDEEEEQNGTIIFIFYNGVIDYKLWLYPNFEDKEDPENFLGGNICIFQSW